ncbi:hypothetical protein [Paraflavitalea sp. CAU 1676]|uniref:hypothetical protein n=1 Tax=Paraflavitalea sp. CAU 1676 TaxID=3032598 RepID=UPI0023D9F4AB|nr:hypothetical protein [Paraflavitalea sp. CAU 1676]MDF2189326.1 hypothetical protein [Paraflavitalea sp. CAU 1676]
MESKFIMPVDASLYTFKFKHVQSILVRYHTFRTFGNKKISVHLDKVEIEPALLKELNNTAELMRLAEAAAENNAKSFWEEFDLKRQDRRLTAMNL